MIRDDIAYISKAHDEQANAPENRVRKSDKRTPYYVHPIWCATTIATEERLDQKTREQGIQVLLYHDILEDTKAKLPEWISDEVKTLVEHMTFRSGNQERREIFEKPPVVRLYKLYDKVNNMLATSHIDQHMMKVHRQFLKELVEDVENNYGQLNITVMARAILA